MPLVGERTAVLRVYAEAAGRGWVIPTFCSENLTTTEAVLAAADEHGRAIGRSDLPVTIGITNLYSDRSQTVNYTHTRRWDIGLRLFLADLEVLTSPGAPFADLTVMAHLDHIQPGVDAELLQGDLSKFASIMFDASPLPLAQNIELTRRFMCERGGEIVVEGACDEVTAAAETAGADLTTPERAARYVSETGVDFLVANLGTEHRASAAGRQYHGDLARRIKARIGPRLVLHGCSSVPPTAMQNLYADGVCKANIWTALERDASPALFASMAQHAAKVAGPQVAAQLAAAGILGAQADLCSAADLGYFTTSYRQSVVFAEMKRVAHHYFAIWYK